MADPVTTSDLINLFRDHSDIRLDTARENSDTRSELQKAVGDSSNEAANNAASIRRELALSTGETIKEIIKSTDNINGDVNKGVLQNVIATKDALQDISKTVGAEADRVTKQGSDYFIAGANNTNQIARDLAALTAGQQALAYQIQSNVDRAASASALESARLASAVALGQSTLSKEIMSEGVATRALINDLKISDLNRALIERNSELLDERHGHRHWRHQADIFNSQGQWATLQSQLQAFQSQLNDTRQGMVNLGTMTGVGQTSTSNNVR
jgi:hypothetical protein